MLGKKEKKRRSEGKGKRRRPGKKAKAMIGSIVIRESTGMEAKKIVLEETITRNKERIINTLRRAVSLKNMGSLSVPRTPLKAPLTAAKISKPL